MVNIFAIVRKGTGLASIAFPFDEVLACFTLEVRVDDMGKGALGSFGAFAHLEEHAWPAACQ